jgi:uncharacterized SAM-binding protein YcdF (DUF218 family)
VRRAVKGLYGILAVTGMVTAGGLAAFGTAVNDFGTRAERRSDGIVVLTGGEHRLAEASRLFAAGYGRRLLISGVNRQTSRDDIRRLSGIPAPLFDCCVDIGYEALDTVGNAEETRAWTAVWRFSRIMVVTSDYHMPRSLAELARAIPSVTLEPFGVSSKNFHADAWWRHPSSARRIVTEYVKFLPAAARLAMTRVHGRVEQSILARAQTLNAGTALAPDLGPNTGPNTGSSVGPGLGTGLGGTPKIR